MPGGSLVFEHSLPPGVSSPLCWPPTWQGPPLTHQTLPLTQIIVIATAIEGSLFPIEAFIPVIILTHYR